MEKLKIWDLEVGKIYRAFYKGVEQNGVFKIGNSGRLFVCSGLEWESSNFFYNEILDTTFEEIKREIDWAKVPRGTKVQVRDDENQEWENRYFIKYIPSDDKEYPFKASKWLDDNYINLKMEYLCDNWKYCRIHESVQIPDDWYKEVK